MSQDDRTSEDVADLFRKFGGDAHEYKEFSAPAAADEQAVNSWPLLSGGPLERAPFAAVPQSRPAPMPFEAAAQAPAAPAAADSRTPTELESLFARLAAPQHDAPPSAGPLSRWRRPT